LYFSNRGHSIDNMWLEKTPPQLLDPTKLEENQI